MLLSFLIVLILSSENHFKFSLIIPCYNESDNIENLFAKIKEIQNELNF